MNVLNSLMQLSARRSHRILLYLKKCQLMLLILFQKVISQQIFRKNSTTRARFEISGARSVHAQRKFNSVAYRKQFKNWSEPGRGRRKQRRFLRNSLHSKTCAGYACFPPASDCKSRSDSAGSNTIAGFMADLYKSGQSPHTIRFKCYYKNPSNKNGKSFERDETDVPRQML